MIPPGSGVGGAACRRIAQARASALAGTQRGVDAAWVGGP